MRKTPGLSRVDRGDGTMTKAGIEQCAGDWKCGDTEEGPGPSHRGAYGSQRGQTHPGATPQHQVTSAATGRRGEGPRKGPEGRALLQAGGKGRPREKQGGERAGQAEAPPMPLAVGVAGGGLTMWLRAQDSQLHWDTRAPETGRPHEKVPTP